jgi:hypothetical protein
MSGKCRCHSPGRWILPVRTSPTAGEGTDGIESGWKYAAKWSLPSCQDETNCAPPEANKKLGRRQRIPVVILEPGPSPSAYVPKFSFSFTYNGPERPVWCKGRTGGSRKMPENTAHGVSVARPPTRHDATARASLKRTGSTNHIVEFFDLRSKISDSLPFCGI